MARFSLTFLSFSSRPHRPTSLHICPCVSLSLSIHQPLLSQIAQTDTFNINRIDWITEKLTFIIIDTKKGERENMLQAFGMHMYICVHACSMYSVQAMWSAWERTTWNVIRNESEIVSLSKLLAFVRSDWFRFFFYFPLVAWFFVCFVCRAEC